MNLVTRWDPFKEMDELNRRLGSLFSLSQSRVGTGKEAMTVAEWSPLS